MHAGYSPDKTTEQASRLLTNANVSDAIQMPIDVEEC
ncbi:hypothetical protein ACP6L2_03840 [Sphingobacterium lactis]